MLRVLFLGTPEFAVPTLCEVFKSHKIIKVVTQPDRPAGRGLELQPPPVKKKALELGLPILQVDKLLPEHLDELRALKPDIAVVVAFGQILKKEFLELPRLGCINLHSSILPRWRGAAPIHWAMLSGDAETGVTTMRIVQKLDAGNILMTERTPISERETVSELHDRLAAMGAPLMVRTLNALESGAVNERVQDEAQVTYAAKLTKEMQWLDPNDEARVLDRKVRALNPWPGTRVELTSGPGLKIKKAKLHLGIAAPVGQIVEKNGMILLGASAGCLELLEMQWDGKPVVTPSAFINGLKGRVARFL